MATLWNAIFDDQSSMKVVIKIPIRANGTFEGELDWHLRYRGASHITQSLDLQEIADNVRRRINRGHIINRGVRFYQKDLDILVLEYAEHGCLFDIMSKASYFGVRFSNKVLWEIWECLVKGVVSVALQPESVKRWSPNSLDMVLNSLDNPQNINELLRLSTLIDSHDVHFDLEEQNILIAEDGHHSHHPILKFHDFGHYSHKMRECWDRWDHYDYWKARRCPKNNRTPPETISEDWDKVDLSSPGSVLQYTGDTFGPEKNEVAGRYGTWTNVFTIGKIMESVITQSWSAHPMTTMIYEAGDERCLGESYAWRLSKPEYSYIEPELLDQIAQCQFEKPQDRPQLSYLLRNVCERKHHGFKESDGDTRSFWDAFWALTRTNPASQPSVPLSDSQTSTISVEASGSQRNYPADRGQREYRSDPFARPSFAGSYTGNSDRQSPPPASPYDEIGNPLITHVAALRRKSRRSLLSASSEESFPTLLRRPGLSTDVHATALDPSAGLLSTDSIPSGGNQRKRSSSWFSDSDSDGGVILRETKRAKHDLASNSLSESVESLGGGVRPDEACNLASITSTSSIDGGVLLRGTQRTGMASASSSSSSDGGVPLRGSKETKHNLTSLSSFLPLRSPTRARWTSKRTKKLSIKSPRYANTTAPDDIISQPISGSPTRLNWAWPIMTMAPRRIPNILEVDVRDGKCLAKYATMSPDRLNLPQSNGGFCFTKRSDPTYYESVDKEASQLQCYTTMMPVDNRDFIPMEVIPEEIESQMDLDM
ncbi:uncharacterized protein TrAFT101_005345 [Trichoderma asperellum]|nr:hypothetical protein TrAFT101_005345 [Trichoderma asperellum]